MKRLRALTLILVTLGCLVSVGCAPSYESIDPAKARQFQSGVSLSEIETELGAHHAATSKQESALSNVIDRMPQEIRANAIADRTVAWGDDSGFLVGKLNDEGDVWVLAWRQGGEAPSRPRTGQ